MAKTTPATATADAQPTARTYEVMSPLNHDQVAYAIGDLVELTDSQAAPLLGVAVRLQPEQAPDQS